MSKNHCLHTFSLLIACAHQLHMYAHVQDSVVNLLHLVSSKKNMNNCLNKNTLSDLSHFLDIFFYVNDVFQMFTLRLKDNHWVTIKILVVKLTLRDSSAREALSCSLNNLLRT